MKYAKVPGTDIEVSQICLGTMTFGTPVSVDDSVGLVEYAMDKGINFIDTANMYEGYARRAGSAGGVAEECVGKAIKGKRERTVVATKVGMNVGNTPLDNGLSGAAIEHNLSKSLKRLDTDYVDIYYAHRYDEKTSPIELAAAMNKEIQKGRIRHFAVSNYTGAQMVDLLKVCDENGLKRPVMCQPALSMLNLDSLHDVMYVCAREGIGIVPYRILQSGFLTGKYFGDKPAPKGTRKFEQPSWAPDLPLELADSLEAIRDICTKINVPMTNYAIEFVLRQAGVVSAIVGVKNKEQIDMAAECVI